MVEVRYERVQPAPVCEAARCFRGATKAEGYAGRARVLLTPRIARPVLSFSAGILSALLPHRGHQNLIIEIDGPCHDPQKDRRRDEWFTRVRGIPVLRLTNEEVLAGHAHAILATYLPPGEAQKAKRHKPQPRL